MAEAELRTFAEARKGKPNVDYFPNDCCAVKGCGAMTYWNGRRYIQDHVRAAHGVTEEDGVAFRHGSEGSRATMSKLVENAVQRAQEGNVRARRSTGERDDDE